ncbi:MAG TPA: 50S ribosomal protein L34 [Patescibacteria group bacterium]|nr:50S ribosomal protein L34 [Patescibacteria group bacterium]
MPKTKRTWQPKKRKRVKKHGFMKRMKTVGGKRILKARKAKGRKVLARSYSGK